MWAPYYTLHKLLAGLLQQFTLAGNPKALALAEALAGYIRGRVRKLAADKGLAHQFRTLNQECGGINEALWSLAALTAPALAAKKAGKQRRATVASSREAVPQTHGRREPGPEVAQNAHVRD